MLYIVEIDKYIVNYRILDADAQNFTTKLSGGQISIVLRCTNNKRGLPKCSPRRAGKQLSFNTPALDPGPEHCQPYARWRCVPVGIRPFAVHAV